jgi:predicted aconitase with swiveling domain
VLVAGSASGKLLRLTHPISFWGGIDPVHGTVVDPRHPQFQAVIAGTMLLVPSSIGSSSSSAIMLELLREGRAPAAILMGEADAILALGVVVGRELGYPPIPIVEIRPEALAAYGDGTLVSVDSEGTVRPST